MAQRNTPSTRLILVVALAALGVTAVILEGVTIITQRWAEADLHSLHDAIGASAHPMRQRIAAVEASVRTKHAISQVSLLVAMAWLAAVAVGIRSFIDRRILTRVDLLRTATEAVNADDLSYRIPWPYADEFTPLAGSLNQVLERLETTTVSKANVEVREAEYRALVQAFPDEILRISGEGPPAVLSGPRSSVTGRAHYTMLADAGHGPDLRSAVQAAHDSGDLIRIELTDRGSRAEGGREGSFEVRVRAIDDNSAIAIVRDITESREMEASLTQAAAEWRQTFDAIEDGIVSIKGAGRTAVIRRVNRAALKLLGGEFGDWIGYPVDALGARQPWARALEALMRLPAGASTFQNASDETGREWQVWCARTGGGLEGGVIVVRNVTELMRLQSSLERSRTMAAMGSLLASVAHEVRNPLFAITSTVQALATRGAEADLNRYQTVLTKEVDRMRHLMTDLLEFGRPFNSRLVVLSVDGVVANAVASCGPLAASLGVRITVNVPALHVEMDEQRLRRVFVNLLENAIQHSPPGGRVRVEGRQAGPHPRRFIDVEVSDEGRGFSDQALHRGCTPFFSERRGGTGLGLAIVSQIVDEHHGEIRLSNAPTGGGRVRVTLPEAVAMATAQSA